MLDRALKNRLASLGFQLNGLLTMHRHAKERIEALERGQARLEQAMLEMAAALRRSGAHSDELRALSLLSSDEDPDRQSAAHPLDKAPFSWEVPYESADPESTIST